MKLTILGFEVEIKRKPKPVEKPRPDIFSVKWSTVGSGPLAGVPQWIIYRNDCLYMAIGDDPALARHVANREANRRAWDRKLPMVVQCYDDRDRLMEEWWVFPDSVTMRPRSW